METEENEKQADSYWENRRLCSDESCIGVIGSDNRCNECGKSYDGMPAADDPPADPGEACIEDTAVAAALTDDQDPVTVSDDDWERRTLCRDESCIGIIGPDGCCNECGAPLENG